MAHTFDRRTFVKLGGMAAVSVAGASILASILSGCGSSSGSGAGSDVIKLGLMGPYTGDVAQYGLAVRAGAELYVSKFNEEGGANGKKVELDAQDEKGNATEAKNVYNKMVEDGVVGIIGDVTSAPSVAVAQASVNDNMPLVSASATAAEFITYGPNAFRVCITDPYQGKLLADFAAEKGYKTVGTIYNSGGAYEKGVNDAFVERAKAKGINVATQQGFADGDVDFKSQLTTIIATNPDAILSPNYYKDDGNIVTQARQLGYKGPFLGADGWSNIVGGDEEYASASDLEGCFYDCSFVAENPDERVQKFISDFKAAHNGEMPGNFSALGYDAAMVLCQAIKVVETDGKAKAGSEEYKQAIIDAVNAGSIEGVTGTIRYEGSGDPVKPTPIITFEGGSQKVVSTMETQ